MAPTHVTSRFLELPSLRLHLLEAGPSRGPLVLLLHGFPELAESWREVMTVLASAGLRCVAPDLRGYGGSDIPDDGYDLDTLTDDVVRLAERLRPGERVHVVGHDWGGVIAYHLAMHHPERVDRLAVVNAPHPAVMSRRVWRPDQLLRSSYVGFFQLPWLPERLLTSRGGRWVPHAIRAAMVHPERVPPEKLAPYAANFARPAAARAALAYYRCAVRGRLAPRALKRIFSPPPPIRAPFRLVWAERDIALGRHLARGLERYFLGPCEVRYLPDVGHFAPLEAPEAVAALLLEHLAPERAAQSAVPASHAGASTTPGASPTP
ncbi:alpha/beta fold hydrolase [Pyxidicoccus xibeiensis]|uniref:alpha/beta fold hydrolase n=1 Tax=Pyxidicoccus xibeiensis TaxID=2906759 RepID=UPI0020A75F4E|nr:alpha/beta hydrolase [Pyxidicoccus xibeiensis]MCP3138254.1 alpha/beta hydrolase [Pyxidicoccus xibeiensis]